MSEPERLSVKITVDGEIRLKVVWSLNGVDFDPYFIDRVMVQEAAKDIRVQLKTLVKECMKTGCMDTGKILKDIAKDGFKLYRALFFDAGKSITKPEDVQQWLAELPGPKRISFNVDDLVHVPWGLIYDADPDVSNSNGYLTGNPEQDDIQSFQSFWCLKYRVSAIYSMITPLSIRDLRPAKYFKMLSVVNKSALDTSMQNLMEPENKILKWVQKTFGEPVTNREEFFKQWKEIGPQINLLYFYCHASGNSLSLDVNDLLNTSLLKLNMKRAGSPKQLSPCMVFINGCSTATGDPKGGFLEATGSSGLCGFIGTETVVPNVFALRFGLAFLYHFIHQGLPVFEVMDILRKNHWPLSLIYSTYCFPELQVGPIGNDSDLPFQVDSNFSLLPLGTNEM
jgi:hypothetical protein